MPPSDADDEGEDEDDAAVDDDDEEHPAATRAAKPRPAIPMTRRDRATPITPPVVTMELPQHIPALLTFLPTASD
jgi:hypothetical protein